MVNATSPSKACLGGARVVHGMCTLFTPRFAPLREKVNG